MGLDALLATMENLAAVTPIARCSPEGVTAKALPIKACTPVTPVTPKTDNTGNDASYVGVGETVTMARCWRGHVAKRDPVDVIFAEAVAPPTRGPRIRMRSRWVCIGEMYSCGFGDSPVAAYAALLVRYAS